MDTKSLTSRNTLAVVALTMVLASANALAEPEFAGNNNPPPDAPLGHQQWQGIGLDDVLYDDKATPQPVPVVPGRQCYGYKNNNTQPARSYASYRSISTGGTGSRCSLCHNEYNRSISRLPEWEWWKAGWPSDEPTNTAADASGQRNFCFVQGIIEFPAAIPNPNPDNIPIPVFRVGSTLSLKARGFSPGGPTYPLTYKLSFDDGRADVVVTPSPANKGNVVTINVPLPAVKPANPKLKMTLTASDSSGKAPWDVDPNPDTREIIIGDDGTVANPDSYSVAAGNSLTVPASTGVLANDSPKDPGWPALQATLMEYPAPDPEKPGDPIPDKLGKLALSPNGNFSYTPDPAYPYFAGKVFFTYKASNGFMESPPATVTLTVTAAPPVANPDSYSVKPDKTLFANGVLDNPPGVLANDGGTPPLTAQVQVGNLPKWGQLNKGQPLYSDNINPDGSFTYTPNDAGFVGKDSFTYMVSNGTVTSTATVTLDVGACTDKDRDGYSPEGGSCGPKDCKDTQPTVNPGLKEICNNKIDDDCNDLIDQADPACNGADCVGALTANQVKIDAAGWSSGVLTVTGSKAKAGATVTVSWLDPVTLKPPVPAPVPTTVAYNGAWKFTHTIASGASAPCRVTVEINGATGVRAVTGSTADCSSKNGAPASCGL